ncbi:hypothetical protein E3V08_05125 [Candidatus Atribacteria bacterium MT.SAG.1]|nr:hypothetical protein E3V08_05125 [Candidatus Atribacteria bacterium MT.SAG.1]
MFKEINKFKIKIHNSDNESIFYIPNIISIHPLDNLLRATDWLFYEIVQDYDNTHKTINGRRKKHGYSQKNLDDLEELNIRIGSRTQSYVNQLCLMEDILIYEYKRMFELVNKASDGKICFDHKRDYILLKKRFSSIRTFRNKVVAHTAYAFPKINKKTGITEDNPETIVRSILNLFPGDDGITLGGNFFSGFSKYKSQLPVITIFSWEQEIRPIFQDWKKLFINRLKKIHKECPFGNKPFRIEIVNHRLAADKNDLACEFLP